jgi:cysteine desulfurase
MPIYLDCNATTPPEPEVEEVMFRAWAEGMSNAGSRTHEFGAKAKQATERARELIATVVGAQRDEVIFTSGATEANNLAILGLADHGIATGRRHIVSTQIEHKAVLEPIEALGKRGFEIELLPPTPGGWIDPLALGDVIRPDTLLVSVMHVNNETGVVQPLDELAQVLSTTGAYLHVDAAQGFGKRLDDLRNPRIDLISVTGHKIYGPQGIGALVARRRGYSRPPLQPLFFGGGQERGLRPGTLPVPLVVGFGRAAELALERYRERTAACAAFRKVALQALAPLAPVFAGDPERMMSHVLNISFPGINSEALMVALRDEIAVSNGSACTSHSYTPSHVLRAMGVSEQVLSGAIRISWCHRTPSPDWGRVTAAIDRLRPRSVSGSGHI